MEQIINQINKQIKSELEAYDAKFREEHKDMLDSGTHDCGYAVVLIHFGRNHKLKQQFEDSNTVRTWPTYGRKCSIVNTPPPAVNIRCIDYYRDRANIVRNVIKQYFPKLDAFVHSW